MRVTFRDRVLWQPTKTHPRDWLLIIGLCLAPMTGFRIWKIGPGEILCLIWGAKHVFKLKSLRSGAFLFFAPFVLALGVGSVIGYIVAPAELSPVGLLTWAYLGVIALSFYEGLKKESLQYNEELFFTFARIATAWYLFLFLYSRYVNSTFLGAPLWYGNARFSGGGTNPHQIAVLLCGIIFSFLRNILNRKRVITSLLCLIACFFLMIQTASSTGMLSTAIGIAVAAYFFIAHLFPRRKISVMVVFTALIALVILLCWRLFFEQFMRWVAEDKNGMGRIGIFASFSDSFIRSPLFGLGPGVHGINGTIEFHNTYLEILAAAGMVGGFVFLWYSIDLFKIILKADWKLFPILVAMYAYGLAGFAMRRLVYWGLITFVTVIAEQIDQRKKQAEVIGDA